MPRTYPPGFVAGRAYPPAGGGVPTTYSELRLADFTQFHNDGTFMTTPPVDLGPGLGWSFSVLGGAGKAVTDPYDGWCAIQTNPLTDAAGNPVTITNEWIVKAGLHELTAPATTSDIEVYVGICNTLTDGAGMYAVFDGIYYNSSQRRGRGGSVAAGVATLVAGTTGLNTSRRLRGSYSKVGTGAAVLIDRSCTHHMDAANAAIAVRTAITSMDPGLTNISDFAPRLFVSVGRATITDGTTRTGIWQPVRSSLLQMTPP